jgi:hypothetical protein
VTGERALPPPESFLSGETGHVAGIRRTAARRAGDRALDLAAGLAGTGRRLDRVAARGPARDVIALSIYRPGADLIRAAATELHRSRHRVRLALGAFGPALPELAHETVRAGLRGGKFANLNAVWDAAGRPQADWLLVVDDDVELPPRFLDRFLALCECFGLALAQPAQTLMSHAAWRIARRRPGSLLRETRFVEIGPVTAFRRDAAAELLPFPALRYGWGLDLHWAALAAQNGWRLGVVDAVPVRHESAPVATAYAHADAIAEAQSFLASRPYVPSAVARRALTTHRRMRA